METDSSAGARWIAGTAPGSWTTAVSERTTLQDPTPPNSESPMLIDSADVAAQSPAIITMALDMRVTPQACKPGAIVRICETTQTVTIFPLGCRRWSCPRCGRAKMNIWRMRTRLSNPQRFFTLTCAPRRHDTPATALARMKAGWPGLVRAIRKKTGSFEYIAIWELHKSGFPHLHILQKGKYVHKKWLSGVCRHFGFGYVCHVTKITNGPHAAHYVTKYLTKSIDGGDGYDIFQRRIWCSRRYFDGSTPDPSPKKEEGEIYFQVRTSVIAILHSTFLRNGWTVSNEGNSSAYHCRPDQDNPRAESWERMMQRVRAL